MRGFYKIYNWIQLRFFETYKYTQVRLHRDTQIYAGTFSMKRSECSTFSVKQTHPEPFSMKQADARYVWYESNRNISTEFSKAQKRSNTYSMKHSNPLFTETHKQICFLLNKQTDAKVRFLWAQHLRDVYIARTLTGYVNTCSRELDAPVCQYQFE